MIITFSIIMNTLIILSLTIFLMGNTVNAADIKSSNQVMHFETTITGNKEQPKFLSIVPWKQITSPVIEAGIISSVVVNRLDTITPEQITMKKDLTQYLKERYLNKLKSTK